MIVVINAIYCLKNSLSSANFVRLNEKDDLLSTGSATKNDGPERFFHYRDVAYDKLRAYLKSRHISTEGEIAAVLNDLHVMKSTEYDGTNTVSMVGLHLVASLGIKREQIGEIFHHTIYDGVYGSAEERVRGGGCLSPNKHFAEWCGLPQDSFTGNWDMGHKLQLVSKL